jgi:hypothetical protein
MVEFSEYRKRLQGVLDQFEYLRFAVSHLTPEQGNEFLKGKRSTAKLKERLGMVPPSVMSEKDKQSLLRWSAGKQSWEYGRARSYQLKELAQERLNQAELLLLVAHFESFMKEVLRAVLRADEKLLASSNEKNLSLEQVFAHGHYNFVKGEVEKQVKKWDSDSLTAKARAFEKRFKIPWGDAKTIEFADEVLNFRHKISHEAWQLATDPLAAAPPKHDRFCVTDAFLTKARNVLLEIPRTCCREAAKRYQSHFKKVP